MYAGLPGLSGPRYPAAPVFAGNLQALTFSFPVATPFPRGVSGRSLRCDYGDFIVALLKRGGAIFGEPQRGRIA
jgi:hypothetical protein